MCLLSANSLKVHPHLSCALPRGQFSFRTYRICILSLFKHAHVVQELLSCQSLVTVTSCFVYKVIRNLESIDHVGINPIHMSSELSIRVSSSGVYKLMVYLKLHCL